MRLALAILLATAGCRGHEHGDEHGHEHGADEKKHDHSDEHPEGHDHHEANHGHGDASVTRITRWTDKVELFAEHGVAVAGQEVTLLAHVTVLGTAVPLQSGALRLALTWPKSLTAEASRPLRPGIYQLRFTPPVAGTYRGSLTIKGAVEDRVADLSFEVHDKPPTAPTAKHDDNYIEFLKEQQWGVTFHTAAAVRGALVETIEVAGAIVTPPNGSADIGAPLSGRLVAPKSGLPHPGSEVVRGQVLASLVPAPASPESATRAVLQLTEAKARLAASESAVTRAERLLKDQAISQKEAEDARREKRVAAAAVQAAQRAASMFSGAQGGGGAGSWRLKAPISGTVVAVDATPGQSLSQGQVIFRIVNTDELWLKARVPEQEAARLRTDRDAAFQLTGLREWRGLRVSGTEPNAKLVSISRVVAPKTRTVDVIYSLVKPGPGLRVGGLVRMALPTGKDFRGVIIPETALLDSDGRHVVYVQVDGEHFEQRVVRVGPRAGARVGILTGLIEGERVVTESAHLVHLTASSSDEQPHGHVH